MKLSSLETKVYDALVGRSPDPVIITDLIEVCYGRKAADAPLNARGTISSAIRSLTGKAKLMELPYQVERYSSLGRQNLGQYRALPARKVSGSR